jgi:hypothetical protein
MYRDAETATADDEAISGPADPNTDVATGTQQFAT